MISRKTGYLRISDEPAPPASEQLQRDGYALLEGVFSAEEVAELAAAIDAVFDDLPPDIRIRAAGEQRYRPFRYEMFNRSEACLRAVAHPRILGAIEPLLGEDCHVIANTAWRQPPEEDDHGGRNWHIDAGPHVPRPEGVPWPEAIPYPVFAVGAHVFLMDCPIESGPTGVIPRSHTSGQPPPHDADETLTWEGNAVVPLVAKAGDVALFASDVWHRRLPSRAGDPGRFFLQCHYGRRDLAQRVRPTRDANQVSSEAQAWAKDDPRLQTLIGLHRPGFYDA